MLQSKMVFLGSNWRSTINTYIAPSHLPVHWGGTMTDDDGDEMCRSRVVVPPGPLPKQLYWRAKQGEPDVEHLTNISGPAGKDADDDW